MTAAFGDFMKKSMEKEKKPSVKARLKTLGQQAQERKREKSKAREAEL